MGNKKLQIQIISATDNEKLTQKANSLEGARRALDNLERRYNKWSIMGIWNETLEAERKDTKERNYISASDVGKNYLDRYLKMKGIQPSNPHEARILRVFAAGNEFHWLVKKIFQKIGILIDTEIMVKIPATEETLAIIGYYDAKVGGFTDWNDARERVNSYGFSDFIENISLRLIDQLEMNHPRGLPSIVCEIKSVNSLAFWAKKDYIGQGYPHHQLQIYTYLKALNQPEGRILYISKDDLTLQECIIKYPDARLEKEWQKDIKEMSAYYLFNKQPDPEPELVFNEQKGKSGLWEVNWELARSPYLTYITGKQKEDWISEMKEWTKELNKPKPKSKL